MAKHAGSGIAGKNKKKCERYRAQGRRLKNKLARILQSNGRTAADAYAREARSPDGFSGCFPRTRGPVPLWQIAARRALEAQ